MKKITILLFIATLLSGCIGVFVAGTAVGAGASAVVYDKRSLVTIRDDQTIGYQIENKVAADPMLKRNSAISASSYHYTVLLVGEAFNNDVRQQIVQIAHNTPKVKRVIDQITIGYPLSAIQRSNDAWITTKVRSMMLTTENLKSSQIKVVTNNGIVYLMGHVSHRQADIAVEVTRTVTGVKKVVKIFEYKNNH